ncbi:hypothetical protein OQA88_12 [Cercophora sp. LCS_1]
MRFTLPLIALATLVSAAYMDVFTVCLGALAACNSQGTFVMAYGSYAVNANTGCRSTSVPGMVEFCVDWNQNPDRAHFRFSHQSFKRCMTKSWDNVVSCPAGTSGTCYSARFDEVGCCWRAEPIEPEAAVSATVAGGETAETVVPKA